MASALVSKIGETQLNSFFRHCNIQPPAKRVWATATGMVSEISGFSFDPSDDVASVAGTVANELVLYHWKQMGKKLSESANITSFIY